MNLLCASSEITPKLGRQNINKWINNPISGHDTGHNPGRGVPKLTTSFSTQRQQQEWAHSSSLPGLGSMLGPTAPNLLFQHLPGTSCPHWVDIVMISFCVTFTEAHVEKRAHIRSVQLNEHPTLSTPGWLACSVPPQLPLWSLCCWCLLVFWHKHYRFVLHVYELYTEWEYTAHEQYIRSGSFTHYHIYEISSSRCLHQYWWFFFFFVIFNCMTVSQFIYPF